MSELFFTHENMTFLVQSDVTYDSVIFLNLWYSKEYDVVCPNVCYIRKCVMSEHITHEYEMFSVRTHFTWRVVICPIVCYTWNMTSCVLHTNIWCLVSERMINMKICNVRTHVTHENMMSRVRTYVTYTMCNVRTYVPQEYEIWSVRTNVTYENV